MTGVWLIRRGENCARTVIIGDFNHEAILEHPDAQIRRDRTSIPSRARLVFSTGIAPDCTDVSAGTHFAVDVSSEANTKRVFRNSSVGKRPPGMVGSGPGKKTVSTRCAARVHRALSRGCDGVSCSSQFQRR